MYPFSADVAVSMNEFTSTLLTDPMTPRMAAAEDAGSDAKR